MNSRNLIAGVGIAAALAIFGGSAAVADPIDLGGYTGPVTFKYTNFEGFSVDGEVVPGPVVGADNFGIFAINVALANDTGPNILNETTFTYVGVFDAVQTTGFTFNVPGVAFQAITSGGTFQLYQVPVGSIDLATVEAQGLAGYTAGGCTGVDTLCYNGITNATGATMVLSWDVNGSLNPLYSFLNNTGSASANATVTGGSDMNQFPGLLSITDDFCFNNGTGTAQCGTGIVNASDPANNWTVLSQDPVNTVAKVPEPTSVALFGAGLLGLAGLFGWRRRKAA